MPDPLAEKYRSELPQDDFNDLIYKDGKVVLRVLWYFTTGCYSFIVGKKILSVHDTVQDAYEAMKRAEPDWPLNRKATEKPFLRYELCYDWHSEHPKHRPPPPPPRNKDDFDDIPF